MRIMHTLGAAVGAGLSGVTAAVPPFTDVTAEAGFTDFETATGMISGVAAADYDNDGDVDLFLPTGPGTPDRLYRNDGAGGFEDVAPEAGLASTLSARAALWFDHDNDGLLDLIVARDCHLQTGMCAGVQSLTFYAQQPGGTFADVTDEAGLALNLTELSPWMHVGGFAAGDLDGDGFLDLVYTQWEAHSYVFRNNGNGTFSDITVPSGFGQVDGPSLIVDRWQPLIYDADGDGLQDIFVAVDFDADEMWINQGDTTFTNMADALGTDADWNGMGAALADIENDGDLDIYVTNIFINFGGPQFHNTLYVNQSGSKGLWYAEKAMDLGVADTGWGWGTGFDDADLDGDQDLAATNGYGLYQDPNDFEIDPSRFFRNDMESAGVFTDVSAQSGFDDTDIGSTIIFADVDRDGDRDLVQTCMNGDSQIRLLESSASQQEGATWLTVRPRMQNGNAFAIGSVVRLRVGETWQVRPILAGTSMAGQEPAEAPFGLAGQTHADELLIRWPGGTVTWRENVAAGQVLDIVAPACAADIDATGLVDSTDLNIVLGRFGEQTPVGDLDGDGTVHIEDLNAVLDAFGTACGGR